VGKEKRAVEERHNAPRKGETIQKQGKVGKTNVGGLTKGIFSETSMKKKGWYLKGSGGRVEEGMHSGGEIFAK